MTLPVLSSVIASCFLLFCLLPFLRRCLIDQPNNRSSHVQPTPRGGGAVFVLISALSATNVWFAEPSIQSVPAFSKVIVLSLPLALVGFLDDHRNLPAGLRYGAQLITAFLLIMNCQLPISWMILLPLLLAVTAIINFINFMDGLDGLVAGCLALAIAALALALAAPTPIWVLVGSLVGFLFWNWSPAKVFMGDVGSTFLGAVFAGLVLQASSWPEAFCYLLVATPLLGDACLCVTRRFLAGQRVAQAHRLHLFQRLHQAGWPHSRVSLIYIAATAVLATAMLAGGLPWVLALAVLELLVGVWLDQRVAVPFALASQS